MDKSMKKETNYKTKSLVYKTLGLSTLGLTTSGGFLTYQILTDWASFQTEFENFMVVQEETVKLNMAIAMPVLIGLIVFIFVAMKKNRDFFRDKTSIGLLLAITILYLVYSVLEVTLASLVGAFVGSLIDEFIFMPLSKKNLKLSEEAHERDLEYDKETIRIKARQQAQKDIGGLNGSV